VAQEVERSQTNDGLTIKFKASRDPAIRAAQEALVQTWGYASTQFLDPRLNGLNWPKELQVGSNYPPPPPYCTRT